MAVKIDSGWRKIIPEIKYNALFSKYPKLKKGEGRISVKNNRTGEEYSHEISNDEFRPIELAVRGWYNDMFSVLEKEFTEAGLIFHPKSQDKQMVITGFKEKWGEFVISLDRATKEQRKEIDGLARKIEEEYDIKIDII